ncbi:hypothetical protein MYAM1_002059 [Malassezia yamatoensis]|uniref:F-box domain-containing protein n=1 Tax=Malassezia yamatoensis TaxID=253288 RepID=A0AAJ5YSE9_9BASI|nr:hypothetical protein MYAM1_002059 [Malassezia yamatoensis]
MLEGAARMPIELWERIFTLLDAGDVVRICKVCLNALTDKSCSMMYQAGMSPRLWRRFCKRLEKYAPLPLLSDDFWSSADKMGHCSKRKSPSVSREVQRVVLGAERLAKRWNTYGGQPFRVQRIRAHVNRITTLKLVVGLTHANSDTTQTYTDCWLVTGSVDGYVRVWDVRKALQGSELDVSQGFNSTVDELSNSDFFADDEESDVESSKHTSTDGSISDDPAIELRRHSRACLVAEADTSGDITSIDAHFHPDTQSLRIAVGSYYSSAGCLLYELNLGTRPYILDPRASLNPPQWSGTQCVSLLGDTVGTYSSTNSAVGTYNGVIHLLDASTGTRSLLERTDRGSIATVKLLESHILAVTRTGQLEIHALPKGGATISHPPIATFALAQRALLTVAISEPSSNRCLQDFDADAKHNTSLGDPLSIVTVDQGGVSHFTMPPSSQTSFPYALPELNVRIGMHGERLIGASIGASAHRAILISNLGGVLPKCAVRSYSFRRPSDERFLPLRPTPDTALPPDVKEAYTAPTRATPLHVPPATPSGGEIRSSRPRRVDSFSSSTSTSSAAPSPSSRFDMLTESAVDESYGIICLASVRGAVWISDYGNLV